MKLWLLDRKSAGDKIYYDEYTGFVIRAPDEETARHMAGEVAGEEGKETWHSSRFSTCCEIIPAEGSLGVVLASFNAG